MSKSAAELAKVVKKQKRRLEKEEAKRLKKKQKKEIKRPEEDEKKRKKEAKKVKKEAKKLKKLEAKKIKKDKKERKKKEKELKRIKKELKHEKKPVPISTSSSMSDRDALSQLGGLFASDKKKKEEKKEKVTTAVDAKANASDKPKIEVKRKVIAAIEKPSVTSVAIKAPDTTVNTTIPTVKFVTPTINTTTPTVKFATPTPSNQTQNPQNPTFPTPVASPLNQQVRKPTTIKTPGERRDINPIYATRTTQTSSAVSRVADPFLIPGLNDTEESRLLTKTFASKWYMPAVLMKIEQQTGLKYRRGRFSEEEKLLAMRLTDKFCQEQNMTLETFKSVFFDDMSREVNNHNRLSNFFVDVSQHFGGRPVAAVYDYLKRTYHPGNHRGAWTAEEDQILLREYEKHGPKWTLIGKELNRLGINCRDRYNLRWKHASSAQSGSWSKDECDRLAKYVAKSLETSGSVTWIWVAEEGVKTRTPLQCYNRWKLESANTKENKITVTRVTKEPVPPKSPKIQKVQTVQTPKAPADWNGWKEDEDYLLVHAVLTTGLSSDDSINWRSLSIPSIPAARANPELYFRRWNHLKSKAEISNQDQQPVDLKTMVEKVKKYLVGKSKSAAYIFSEDEEEVF